MKWISGQDAPRATNPLRFDIETLSFIDRVEIFWPDERAERLTGLAVDTVYTFREGDVPS